MTNINLLDAAVLVDGLDHPEAVTMGPDGLIYAGGEAGQLYRFDHRSPVVETMGRTSGLSLGVVIDGASRAFICSPGERAVMRIVAGHPPSVVTRGPDGRPFVTPNFAAFGPDGFLYVTDSGTWKANDGFVCAIGPDGTCTVIDAENSQFPNGCAVSPDGRELFVAMSLGPPRIVKFPIREGRRVGPATTVVLLPGTVPDGLAFCDDGGLLVSCYRPDAIFRVEPTGNVQLLMADDEGTLLGAPTNVCFCGPDLSVLLWANLGRWHIGINARTGLRGAPLFYPEPAI